ncbi:MAG TPA: peptidylprolyl isomerase [Thermoguttaceae bacterium]|nr:peptidylprolyl isomerase [Thermoguttaceae bacterium]
MRRGRKIFGLFWLAGVAIWAGCSASPPAAEPTERSRERADFDAVLDEWNPFIDGLRQLRKDYASAPPEARPELEKEYVQMVKKGQFLEAQLVDAAVIACVKQPEENQDLSYFLMDMAGTLMLREEYEDSLSIAQKLIDNRLGNYMTYYFAAIAAFAANEFDLAARHFEWLDENERRIPGKETMAQRNLLKEVVREVRADLDYYKEVWPAERELREREKAAADLPRVLLKTNRGEIELELFEDEAPNTVANFISLVEKGFYDGLTFFYVEQRLLAQTGCPEGDGTGGPGHMIRCECYQPNHRLHFRGSVSMATKGPNTGGSQFCIAFRPIRALDGKQTVFGRVVRGMDVLARLQRRKPDPEIEEELLPKPDKIVEATVLRKRSHPYEPKIILPEEPDEITKKILEEFQSSEGFSPF